MKLTTGIKTLAYINSYDGLLNLVVGTLVTDRDGDIFIIGQAHTGNTQVLISLGRQDSTIPYPRIVAINTVHNYFGLPGRVLNSDESVTLTQSS